VLKFAHFAIIEAKTARTGNGLMRNAHRASFDYSPRAGFLYVRSRAISSRCNDNFDEFPAEEIKKAYATFVGKPIFVNHHNADHRRARGVIVDAVLHEDRNHDGSPDTWVEVLMEVDAVKFPMLAQAIIRGEIDRTSMGTDVAYSKCSACGNKAVTPLDYCDHIRNSKGRTYVRRTASGEAKEELIREICYGLGFFENSLLVEEPADPTAYFLGVDTRGLNMTSSKKVSAERPVSGYCWGRYADGKIRLIFHGTWEGAYGMAEEMEAKVGTEGFPVEVWVNGSNTDSGREGSRRTASPVFICSAPRVIARDAKAMVVEMGDGTFQTIPLGIFSRSRVVASRTLNDWPTIDVPGLRN